MPQGSLVDCTTCPQYLLYLSYKMRDHFIFNSKSVQTMYCKYSFRYPVDILSHNIFWIPIPPAISHACGDSWLPLINVIQSHGEGWIIWEYSNCRNCLQTYPTSPHLLKKNEWYPFNLYLKYSCSLLVIISLNMNWTSFCWRNSLHG